MSRRRAAQQRPVNKPDGDLTAALAELHQAIDKLVEPQIEWADDRIVTSPSLYRQIHAVVAGMQGSGNGHAARSMPPVWCDAVDILNAIETALDAWRLPPILLPEPPYAPGTPNRIRKLAKRAWRPQDTERVHKLAKALNEWADEIDLKLNPPRRLHIAAACPECGATTVKHRDATGEMVNGPALTVIADYGCTCLECGTHWSPELYRLLAKVLECPLPAGVLAE